VAPFGQHNRRRGARGPAANDQNVGVSRGLIVGWDFHRKGGI